MTTPWRLFGDEGWTAAKLLRRLKKAHGPDAVYGWTPASLDRELRTCRPSKPGRLRAVRICTGTPRMWRFEIEPDPDAARAAVLREARWRDFAAERDAVRREHAIVAEGMRPARAAYAAAEAAGLPDQARRLAEAVTPALETARAERTFEAVGALLAARTVAERAFDAVAVAAGHPGRAAHHYVSGVDRVAIATGLANIARLLDPEASPGQTGAYLLDADPADAFPMARRRMIARNGGESATMELVAIECAERGTISRFTERLWSRYGVGSGYGSTWGPGSNDAVTKVW